MHFRNNILVTLAYYDVFDFPLKKEEIFEFLISFEHLEEKREKTLALMDLESELERLVVEGTIDFSDDFYFLFDRDYLVPLRLRREKMARKKWRKVFRAVGWLKFLPYIKAVFASGSLAMNNMEELGDLDVLVVAKHGRIWLSRLLISSLLSLVGVRRKYSDKIAPDKVCLNHYITDKSLHIPYKSIYTAQTYINLKPIFVSDPRIITEFYKANSWLGDYIQNFNYNLGYDDIMIYHRKGFKGLEKSFLAKIATGIGEAFLNGRIGGWLERRAKNWQVKRIEEHKKQNPPGGRVVYNDEQLEFHPGSVEKEIIERYNQRLKNLGIGELAVEKNSGLAPTP